MQKIRILLSVVLAILMLAACKAVTDPTQTSSKLPSGPLTSPNTTAMPESVPQTTTGPVPWSHEAALSRFLTQINHEGSIAVDTSGEAVPPGTPPDVNAIPKADQSLIGENVQIILAQEQYAVPFYYSYEEASGMERLAVIIDAEKIPMLIIFETELNGAEGLCEMIASQEPFNATILAMVNISFMEGAVYAPNASLSDVENGEEIDVFADTVTQNAGIFIGFVGTDEAGNTFHILKGTEAGAASSNLQDSINVYLKIFARFDLMAFIDP